MIAPKYTLPRQKVAIGWSIGILFFCLAGLFCRKFVIAFANSNTLPDCSFHNITGYLCPACGNTRAVLSLLQGHFFRSFGYNPMIPVLALVLLGLYAELVCYACGKRVRIVPRSNIFLFATIGAILFYDIVRNFFPSLTLCL